MRGSFKIDGDGALNSLTAVTWNIAAINNNPFEYWVTMTDSSYNQFMREVEKVVAGIEDTLLVSQIFTEKMFSDLLQEMELQNFSRLDEVKRVWEEDLSKRKAINEFLKDKTIGEKRLTSMPDRITNTINLNDGRKLRRPTVINAYDKRLGTFENWWEKWKEFMFATKVQIFRRDTLEPPPQLVCSLLGPINRNKYPAITPEEQAISVQLQLLCLAILDAIFVHIVGMAAPTSWEDVRRVLCDALIHNKDDRVCAILVECYLDRRVIFIQEASAAFVHKSRQRSDLMRALDLHLPEDFDGKRDQNSIIFVSRDLFDAATAFDATPRVLQHVEGNFCEPGDLFALSIHDRSGQPWLLVSFHGDSNGLSTRPLLIGLHQACRQTFPGHRLVAGLDANTFSHRNDRFHPGVAGFRRLLRTQRMRSSWDGCEEDRFLRTTCSARTLLQTQLNKAVALAQRFSAASVSLKDWILAYESQARGKGEREGGEGGQGVSAGSKGG